MSHHKIQAENLSFSYADKNNAIDNISFLITHGQSVGVIGANGAGKSTLLMLLLGVLMPSTGKAIIGDVKVEKNTLPIIRSHIGMVFQNPEHQLFMPKVYDDIAFGPRNLNLSEDEVEKRVNEALFKVGILHLKDRSSYKLSWGEKRCAAIASVLSMSPDILLMDEPTDALDGKARRRIIELLKTFSHTKIIASHDLDMIFELCERTIVILDGQIKADGNTKDILSNISLLNECGLEIPLSMQNCKNCGLNKNMN